MDGSYKQQKQNREFSSECSDTCGKRIRQRTRVCYEVNLKGKLNFKVYSNLKFNQDIYRNKLTNARTLKEVDPQKCDDDNKSDQNSNEHREVCEPQACSE